MSRVYSHLDKLYRDLKLLVYLEIYKYKIRLVNREYLSLFRYLDGVGVCDDDYRKRYNWRDLENTFIKCYYGGPIYKEMTYIGKITCDSEFKAITDATLPSTYMYSTIIKI